jgi:hypothetical protein
VVRLKSIHKSISPKQRLVFFVWGAEYLTIEKRGKKKRKKKGFNDEYGASTTHLFLVFWPAIQRDELARSISPGGFKSGHNILDYSLI